MNSGCAAALDRLQDFCFMAIKAANREPCTPPRSTLILTPAFVVYTELGIDPGASSLTISEIISSDPALKQVSYMKVSTIVRRLVSEGVLIREEYMQKAYFRLR